MRPVRWSTSRISVSTTMRTAEAKKKITITFIAIRSNSGWVRRDMRSVQPRVSEWILTSSVEGLVGHVDFLLGPRRRFLLAQALLEVVLEEVFEVRGDLHEDQAPGRLRAGRGGRPCGGETS